MKDRIVVLRIHQRVPSARSDFAIFDQPVLLLEAEYRSASVRAEFAITTSRGPGSRTLFSWFCSAFTSLQCEPSLRIVDGMVAQFGFDSGALQVFHDV